LRCREGRGTLKELEIGNPPGYAGAYAMRFGTVSVEIDPAQSNRELIVPDVHLSDIGRSTNGVDAATVVALVLGPITKGVTRKMTDAARKGIGVDSSQFESEAAHRMRETLKSLGHPTRTDTGWSCSSACI
jgi:hypothetical protein